MECLSVPLGAKIGEEIILIRSGRSEQSTSDLDYQRFGPIHRSRAEPCDCICAHKISLCQTQAGGPCPDHPRDRAEASPVPQFVVNSKDALQVYVRTVCTDLQNILPPCPLQKRTRGTCPPACPRPSGAIVPKRNQSICALGNSISHFALRTSRFAMPVPLLLLLRLPLLRRPLPLVFVRLVTALSTLQQFFGRCFFDRPPSHSATPPYRSVALIGVDRRDTYTDKPQSFSPSLPQYIHQSSSCTPKSRAWRGPHDHKHPITPYTSPHSEREQKHNADEMAFRSLDSGIRKHHITPDVDPQTRLTPDPHQTTLCVLRQITPHARSNGCISLDLTSTFSSIPSSPDPPFPVSVPACFVSVSVWCRVVWRGVGTD